MRDGRTLSCSGSEEEEEEREENVVAMHCRDLVVVKTSSRHVF